MAFKKIDKVFVLSDSTKNVYGFRLRTDGCVMEEVLKNPIGYYNHERDGGVLLRWEDVQLNGDNIEGKPVVNLEHPRAERTIKEIEDGFLSAASVGNICLIDHEFEENPEDPENPVLVATKWYYKECSLVDSPGNRNAFKTSLFDIHDNEINLADLLQVQQSTLKNQQNMKKVELQITPALISILSLGDEPTAKQVADSIQDLHDRATGAEADLKDLQETTTEKEVTDLLDKAIADKKITAKLKDTLAKQYRGKPDDLKDVLDGMGAFVSVNTKLNLADRQSTGTQDMTPEVKALVDEGWDKLHKSGKLADLKDKAPDVFEKMYEKKYGHKPNTKPFVENQNKKR